MKQERSFGGIVKERRYQLGLTQAELARRASCAAITIRKIEANALRPSIQIAEQLAIALNIPEDEQLAFVRLARAEPDPSPLPTPEPIPEEIGQADLSGRAIKGFDLGERIGTGGYGVVYRATQATVGRDVAIKIILPKYADRPEFIRRFETEAHLVARLEHPHIVPLYDYWREPGKAFLVMRLLSAGSLETQLNAGPIPPETVLAVMEHICTGLHTAHRAGVVHRDIKPANILLDDDGNAYLADFGIAKLIANEKPADITREGTVIGSPAYISPEQILAEPVKPQTDIYSLGVMLYEMLTGRKPFRGPTSFAYIQQHLNQSLPLLDEENGHDSPPSSDQAKSPDAKKTPSTSSGQAIPTALDIVIGRATAKDQRERYPDILTMLADLRRAMEPGSTAATLAASRPVEIEPSHVSAMLKLPDLDNPYKGLRPFTEADAADFFGRDTLIQDLLTRLADPSELARFLAVVGPSGSGKSSVVRAGLLPVLRQGGFPGSEKWFIVEMLPGAHPLEELEAALLRVAINPPEHLLDVIKKDERGLLRAVRQILPVDRDVDLVLVIDQFEEVFTQVEREADRVHLLNSLVTAVLDPHSRLRIIITLRADFTGQPLQYVDFGDMVRQRSEFVLPLTADELEQAIVGPTERAGLALEPELMPTIIRDIGGQPGMLPLLQYALTELFERRDGRLLTLDAYRASGGVLGALTRRADELYDNLSDAGRAVTRRLFTRLVTLGEGVSDGSSSPNTRRRVLRAELTSLMTDHRPPTAEGTASELSVVSRQPPALSKSNGSAVMDDVIVRFGHYRLLTFDHDPVTRGPTVEVAHEALIREWGRLRRWLDEDREFLLWQQRLRAGLHQWEASNYDEGALLRGAPLTEAETWFNQRQADLNADEQEFIQASLDLRTRHEAEREQERLARERLRRRITGGLAVGLVIAIALLLLAGWQWQTAAQERQVAVEAQSTAAAERDEAEASLSRQLAVQALTQMDSRLDLALLLGVEAARTADTPEARGGLLSVLDANRQLTTYLRDHIGPVRSVAFSPDGKMMASGSNDTTIILWDVSSGQPLGPPLTGHTDTVRSVTFSPNGQTLASASFDGTIILWDAATGQSLGPPLTDHTGGVWNVAFSPDGQTLASASEDNTVMLWDLSPVIKTNSTSAPLTGVPLHGHNDPVTSVAFSPDGQILASASIDNTIILWDAATGLPLGPPLTSEAFAMRSLAFSPDGQMLAAGTDNAIVLWDTATQQPLGEPLTGHAEAIWSVAFSPDGKTLASSSVDGAIMLWDTATLQVLGPPLTGHYDAVWSVAFSPDGQTMASASSDNTVILWQLNPRHPLGRTLIGHEGAVYSVAFSPDRQTLVSGGEDKAILLWDVKTGRTLGPSLTGHNGVVWSVAFSPDGQILAAGTGDKSIILWDVATRQTLGPPLTGHKGDVETVAFSPDGQILASGSTDNTIILWDVATGQLLGSPLTGHTQTVSEVAFSPDGQTLASGSQDETLILWDVTMLQALGHYSTNQSPGVETLAFSPDGRTLATGGGFETTLILWDVANINALNGGQFLKALSKIDDTDDVRSLTYSPDGNILALGSWLNTVNLWDVVSGQPIASSLQGHSLAVTSVAFNSDGKTLASASEDGTIILWDTSLESWQVQACRRSNRNLSRVEWQQFFGLQPYRATCPELPVPAE